MKVKCPRCGFEDEGNFCSNCGAPLPKESLPEGESERVAAASSQDSSWLGRCPVCKKGKLKPVVKKKLLGLITSRDIECTSCGAVFVPRGQEYKLAEVKDDSSDVWKIYGGKSLTTREWKNIANGGMSDERQKEADIEYYLRKLKSGDIDVRMSDGSSVLLKKNEKLIFDIPDITLWEPRSVRETSGSYGGPSIRVAKGLYFRLGAFNATSESHEELRVIDRGRLVLTDRRLVFSGGKRTVDVRIRKILSVEPYSDGFALRREGRVRTQYFTGIDKARIKFEVDDRTYEEPFSGLVLMYMIEGLAKRQNS